MDMKPLRKARGAQRSLNVQISCCQQYNIEIGFLPKQKSLIDIARLTLPSLSTSSPVGIGTQAFNEGRG